MPRNMPAALIAAFQRERVQPRRAVEIDFPSGTLRLWTGRNTTTFNGNTFFGVQSIMGFGDVEETSDMSANGTTVTVSGVDESLVALALQEPYQGSAVRLWLGEASVPGVMVEIGSGVLDTMPIDDQAATATITITVENILLDLDRPRDLRYTDEHQQALYPGDMAFEFVAEIQDMEIK